MKVGSMGTSRIALIIDSCTDVPPEEIKRYGMYLVPVQVNYANETFLDRITIAPREVYDRLSEEVPTTSMPTPAMAQDILNQVVADGYNQAVIIAISSGLSATYELLHSAALNTPALDCCVVDTKNIGLGAGLVVLAIARRLANGATLDDIRREAPNIVEHTHVYFCLDTLEYLHKGGRIGNVTYMAGSLLDVRPVISCDKNGVYCTVAKAKGRIQSLKKTIQCAKRSASQYSRCVVAVVNGDAHDAAVEVKEKLEKVIDNVHTWYEGDVSPALVVHTGPGLVGIAVQGD